MSLRLASLDAEAIIAVGTWPAVKAEKALLLHYICQPSSSPAVLGYGTCVGATLLWH